MKKAIRHIYKYILSKRRLYLKRIEMQRLDSKVEIFCRNNKINSITQKEYELIYQYWYPFIDYKVQPYYYNMLHSYKYDFPLFQAVSESVMYPNLMRKLNPIDASTILSNKGMYGFIFNDVNRPCELIRCCNGNLYDKNNHLISLEQGIDEILAYNLDVIIKPTVDTYGGHGVKIIANYTKEVLNDIIKGYGDNYVVQMLVAQSEQTKRFNPTSLNTFRIITLFLNGKITVLSSIFRCGGKGAIVDNASSGGMFIGIKENGQLTRGTSYTQLEINESPIGLRFSEYKIEHFDKVLKFAKSLHERIPLCAFAGWDIALNENNQPVFMEVNLNCPDVWLMQVLNGPIFGERFEEVIKYCFKTK